MTESQDGKKDLQDKFWVFGLRWGALIAIPLSLLMAAWNWLDNPGDIFHSPEGTNWRFVVNTVISWLVPAFLVISLFAGSGHLVYSTIKRRR